MHSYKKEVYILWSTQKIEHPKLGGGKSLENKGKIKKNKKKDGSYRYHCKMHVSHEKAYIIYVQGCIRILLHLMWDPATKWTKQQ